MKKEKVSILTGDLVELEDLSREQETAVIVKCLERSSLLSRPQIANVDQVVIVQAVKQPEWNQLWCDRYIVHFQLELPQSVPILCFNKCDLLDEEKANRLRDIYESLNYQVVMVSAKTQSGIQGLIDLLKGKITVFAGPSGVGKSSLLNSIEPSLNLKIGVMDSDVGVGRHTTTYSEIYQVHISKETDQNYDIENSLEALQKSNLTWVADTPGFNLAELRHPEPHDLMWEFPEIKSLAPECKFSNCLHLVETDCNVIANIVEDDFHFAEKDEKPKVVSRSRYENYVTIVNESISEQNIRKETSSKNEGSVKSIGGGKKGKAINIPKLSGKYRAKSRRTEKQKIKIPDEDEYLEEDLDLDK